jgi:hypothetical protein
MQLQPQAQPQTEVSLKRWRRDHELCTAAASAAKQPQQPLPAVAATPLDPPCQVAAGLFPKLTDLWPHLGVGAHQQSLSKVINFKSLLVQKFGVCIVCACGCCGGWSAQ